MNGRILAVSTPVEQVVDHTSQAYDRRGLKERVDTRSSGLMWVCCAFISLGTSCSSHRTRRSGAHENDPAEPGSEEGERVSGWSKTACRLRVGLSVGLSVRSALTLCLHQHLTTPCATSEKARGTANRRVGRAVPGTPLRGVTGEPHTGWLQRKHTVPQPEGAASVPLVAVDGACN